MNYDSNDNDGVSYPASNVGSYQMNRDTGMYMPHKAAPVDDPNLPLSNVLNSLMRNYVRKQSNPGSYLPITSVAPENTLDAFKPLDKYRSFGVPYTGIPYGHGQGQGSPSNPYAAMFTDAPGSGGSGGGY